MGVNFFLVMESVKNVSPREVLELLKTGTKRNHLKFSFGLVVHTSDGCVLLQRRVPYCIQDYFYDLNERGCSPPKFPFSFKSVRTEFEEEGLPFLSRSSCSEYRRFLNGESFEDQFDFPHGQLSREDRQRILHMRPDRALDVMFATAKREFVEETELDFGYKQEEVRKFPLKKVEFLGLNGLNYIQFFFILGRRVFRKKMDQPIRSWNDDRLLYFTKIMSRTEAFQRLHRQQLVKADKKHLLLGDE